MAPPVRTAGPDDLSLLTSVGAAAFFDDPVMSWVFQDPDTRAARLLGLFSMPATDMLAGRGVVHVCDEVSVALWRDPTYEHGSMRESDDDVTASAVADFTDAELERLLHFGAAMTANHPHEPHWYLNILATLPARQGAGLGAAALAPVLERCDADGVPAYLVSTSPRNRPFYRRQGFAGSGEIQLPDGPEILPMWRDPR